MKGRRSSVSVGLPDKPTAWGRRRPVERVGGSKALRDTSSAYKALRASVLDQEPLCRYCRHEGLITAATIVDHILALSLGGSNDRPNLAPACQPCNSAKAKAEQAFLAKGYDLADVRADPALRHWFDRSEPLPPPPIG